MRPSLKTNLLAAVVLGWPCLLSAQIETVTVANLDAFDKSPQVAGTLDTDRVIKSLIVFHDADDRISRQLLDREISASLTDGSAMTHMAADLARGDSRLEQALRGVLIAFNYNDAQAHELLVQFASTGSSDQLAVVFSDAAQHEAAIEILSDYLLTTPEWWPKLVGNIDDLVKGNSSVNMGMIRSAGTLSNLISEKQFDETSRAALSGDIGAKWRLADLGFAMHPGGGGVGRFLSYGQTMPDCWYAYIWQKVLSGVSSDPLLLSEYVQRTYHADPLYSIFRQFIMTGLRNYGGTDFIKGYLRAGTIEGSRYAWILADLSKSAPSSLTAPDGPAVALNVLLAKMEASPKYFDYIAWQLTRYAEPVSLTIRSSLPDLLGTNVEMSRALLDATLHIPALGPLFEAGGAYSFYGTADVFRAKEAAGPIDDDAAKSFGRAAGIILRTNDTAWNALVGAGDEATEAKQKVFCQVVVDDPTTLKVVMATIRDNDASLKKGFCQWLIRNQKTQDEGTFDRWSDAVYREVDSGDVVGNADAANFKLWFSQYLVTFEGWAAFDNHLRAESSGINGPLRTCMERAIEANPNDLWKVLRVVNHSSGSSIATLKPDIQNYVIDCRLPQSLLQEVAHQNPQAVDAVFPIWGTLLCSGPKSPVLEGIMNEILTGDVLNDTYSLYASSMESLFGIPELMPSLEPKLRLLTNSPAEVPMDTVLSKARVALRQQGNESLGFAKMCFEDPVLREAWRLSLLNQVRVYGKAYVVADVIIKSADLQQIWADNLVKAVINDQTLMENMFKALSYLRVGDKFWAESLKRNQEGLITLIVEDRVFMEQILTQKGALIDDQANTVAASVFGEQTAQEWAHYAKGKVEDESVTQN